LSICTSVSFIPSLFPLCRLDSAVLLVVVVLVVVRSSFHRLFLLASRRALSVDFSSLSSFSRFFLRVYLLMNKERLHLS
jgi:hypothetical protein